MLSEERKQLIVRRVHAEGRVLVAALSAELGVSEDTIRRDLRELAAEGLVQRVHGGALPRSPAAGLDVAARAGQATEEKRALAAAAAGLVAPGQTVVIDGGSSNLLVAEALPADLAATVVTNSPAVALALLRCPRLEVALLGGKLVRRAGTVAGPDTVDGLRALRADLCLLGVCCVDAELGVTCAELDEVHVKRAMVECAAEVVALATADKLDSAAAHVVAPVSALTRLLVTEGLQEERMSRYAGLGPELVRVPLRPRR